MFLGSTLPIVTGGCYKFPEWKPEILGNKVPGKLKSYRFELDEIVFEKCHVANFPLEDKLIVTYDTYPLTIEETYLCFNWQYRGISFDIQEFLDLEWVGDIGTRSERSLLHKLYRDHRFYLNNTALYETNPVV